MPEKTVSEIAYHPEVECETSGGREEEGDVMSELTRLHLWNQGDSHASEMRTRPAPEIA
jgi:hypothetical protein